MRALLVFVAAAQQESAADMFRDAADELHHFDNTDLRALQHDVQPSSLLQEGGDDDFIYQQRKKYPDLPDNKQFEALENAMKVANEGNARWDSLAKKLQKGFHAIEAPLHPLAAHKEADGIGIVAPTLEEVQSHNPSKFPSMKDLPDLEDAPAAPSSLVQETSTDLAAQYAKEFAQSSATEQEVKEDTANALRDAALKDAEEIDARDSTGAARPHSQRVEVRDFKEAMEATMSAQKKKLSSFLENMKNQFHQKLERDANTTHWELQQMRIQEAKDMSKLEQDKHMSGSLLEQGAKVERHPLDPEVLRQNDADMQRSRDRVAAIQSKLEKEEARMRNAAQQLAQSNAPDFATDTLSLDVLNAHNFRH